eukprot:g13560.t1
MYPPRAAVGGPGPVPPGPRPRDYEDDDGAEGFDVRPLSSRGLPASSPVRMVDGGRPGISSPGEPMPGAWPGHDRGGPGGGPPGGYYSHYDYRRSAGVAGSGGVPGGAKVNGPDAAEDDRFHAYPIKYRRTAGAGWATRHPPRDGGRSIGGEPPRYLEGPPPMTDQPGGDVSERHPTSGKSDAAPGGRPRSPPGSHWRASGGGGGGGPGQRRAVSPSNVSRADVNAAPGSAAPAPGAENPAGGSPQAKPYGGGDSRDGGHPNNPAWKPAVGWQARRSTPPRNGEAAADEDAGPREEGPSGGDGGGGGRDAAAGHSSSSYSSRNCAAGGGGGGERRDDHAAASRPPSGSPNGGSQRPQQQQKSGDPEAGGRPGAAIAVLPPPPSGVRSGPPSASPYGEDPADHHPRHHYHQQAYEAELAERYRQGGRKARFESRSRAGATASAAAAAARGGRPSSGGAAPWEISGGPPPGWRQSAEYWGGGPGYHPWGGPMMPEPHHLGSPPVSKRHLLPWPIEKIEEMEAMGAGGRAGEDDETWVRIAAAMSSSVSEAKDQWASYCEMMRHKRWMSGSGGADGSAGSSRAMMPSGGPPVPPPWAAGEHPAWRYRAEAAAAGYPSRGGVPPPEAGAYRGASAYGAPPPGPMPGLPDRPASVAGRCAFCGEMWNTNSPTAAAAIQAGRWCCPACESGAQPGPMPRHWEDEEGYIAMPRIAPGHHHPYYSAEAAAASAAASAAVAAGEHPFHGRSPPGGWPERGRTNGVGRPHGSGSPSERPPTWREEEADIQAEAAARQAASRRSQGSKSPTTVMGSPAAAARSEHDNAPPSSANAAASPPSAGNGSNSNGDSRRSSPPPLSSSGGGGGDQQQHRPQQNRRSSSPAAGASPREGNDNNINSSSNGDSNGSGRGPASPAPDGAGDSTDASGSGKPSPARGSSSGDHGRGEGGSDAARPPRPSSRGSAPPAEEGKAMGLEKMLAKQSGERGAVDPLEESGYTTDQAGTPTRDSQWLREDDEKLLELVEARANANGNGSERLREGEIDWERVASNFDGRTAAQCEARWSEHVNPALQERQAYSRRPEGGPASATSSSSGSARQEASATAAAADGNDVSKKCNDATADDRHDGRGGTQPEQNSQGGAPRHWRQGGGAGRNASPGPGPGPRHAEHATASHPSDGGGYPPYVPKYNRADKPRKPDPRAEAGWGHHHQLRQPQQYRSHLPPQHPHYRGGGGGSGVSSMTQGMPQHSHMVAGPPPESSSRPVASWGPHAGGSRRPPPHHWIVSGGGADGREEAHRLDDYGRVMHETGPSRAPGPHRMAPHAGGAVVMMEAAGGGADFTSRGRVGGRGASQSGAAAEEPYGWYVGGKNKGRGAPAPAVPSADSRRGYPEEGETSSRRGEAGQRSPPRPPQQQQQQQQGGGGGNGATALGRSSPTAAAPAANGGSGGGSAGTSTSRSPSRESPKATLMARVAEGARWGGGSGSSPSNNDRPPPKQEKNAGDDEQQRASKSGGGDGAATAPSPPQQHKKKLQRTEERGIAGGGGGDDCSFVRKKSAMDSLTTEGWTFRTSTGGARRGLGISITPKLEKMSPSSSSSSSSGKQQQKQSTASDSDGGRVKLNSSATPAAAAAIAKNTASSAVDSKGGERELADGRPAKKQEEGGPRRGQRMDVSWGRVQSK